MSTITDLPKDLLVEIFARLPVKAVVVLTRVCKAFKTLIISSDFLHLHYERNPPMRNAYDHLLVRTTAADRMSRICASTFARVLDIELPANVVAEFGHELAVYGSYDGLLCISTRVLAVDTPIYLWNPSIGRIRRLPNALIPATYDTRINSPFYRVTLGFGFHSAGGNDYKVIKFVHPTIFHDCTLEVGVYSLNTNTWKRIRLPQRSRFVVSQPKCAYLNGVVYWILHYVGDIHFYIGYFDLQQESFNIRRCDVLNPGSLYPNSIQVWNNSLSLFCLGYEGGQRFCQIYIMNMETSELSLFRNLRMESFTVPWPLGFNTSGSGLDIDVVIRIDTPTRRPRLNSLFTVGEGLQKRWFWGAEIELHLSDCCWYVDVYRESLLLLDR